MKSLKYIICAVMLMLSFTCQAQRMLSEVASMKGVTSIFIGKTMLKFAGASMSLAGDQSAIDMSKLIKDLTSIEIISCEDKAVAQKVEKKCKNILSKYNWEVITETSSEGQKIEISGVFDKDGKNIETLLIAVNGNDDSSFILLKGKIDVLTLNNALIED